MRFERKEISFIQRVKNNQLIKKMITMSNYEGFYLVLFICFCIVTAAAVWTVKANVERIENMNDLRNIQLVQKDADNSDQTEEDEYIKPVIKEGEDNEEDAYAIEIQDEPAAVEEASVKSNTEGEVISSTPMLAFPVDGTICLEYSEESLVYSKTLDQYVVHKGIDIEAPLNTPVCAAADGIITKIEEDKQMGVTIWIQHDCDLVTIYSNLSTTEMVNEGDEVTKGDVISGVGDTALFEILEVPHLHFEVLREDHHENPMNHLE